MEEKHKLNSQERQVNRMITGVRRQDRRNWKSCREKDLIIILLQPWQ